MINSRAKFIQAFDGTLKSLGVRLDIFDNIRLFKTRANIRSLMKFLSSCGVKFINIGSIFSCINNKQISSFAIDPRIITPAVIDGKFDITDTADSVIQFFINNKTNKLRTEFANFCDKNEYWLENYAAFCAISQQTGTNDFSQWPEILRTFQRKHVEVAKKQLSNEVFLHKILQFFSHKQLQLIKNEANSAKIFICGDCDVLCENFSADIWSRQKSFFVSDISKATIFAGLPPNEKQKNGLKTTKVPYRVAHLKETNYEFFEQMFAHLQEMFDAVFLLNGHSIFQFWEVARHENDPKYGRWVNVPTDKFFEYLDTNFNNFPYLFDFNEPLFPNNDVISKRHNILQVVIDGEPTTHHSDMYDLTRKLFAISSTICDRKIFKLNVSENTLTANTESCIKSFKKNKLLLCVLHFSEILNFAKCSAEDALRSPEECAKTFIEKLNSLTHRKINTRPKTPSTELANKKDAKRTTFLQKSLNFLRKFIK